MERTDFLVKIYLDPGHGGNDGGAAANGIKEKDIVLKLVKKMKALLDDYENTEVILSREADVQLSLEARTKKANNANADVLVSVHINAASAKAATGFESYRYVNSDSGTLALQNTVHAEIMKAMGSNIEDRGKKQANFHMLRDSKMKAILTENLFISNSKDASLLKQDSFLDKVAQGHVNGLQKFLGLKRIEKPPKQNEPIEQPTGKLYIVQVGAFEDKENAEALAADLRKEGYRPFIKYE
jgi:N-acetylmuramoyl-L-alanine amidase